MKYLLTFYVVIDPKIYTMMIIEESSYIVFAGDHTYTPIVDPKQKPKPQG
jgi:hypothetical protein